MNFLLSDEINISSKDYLIRESLYNEFKSLPKDFFSRMRHFQPQVGCFNNCGFCSKFSVCKSEYWNICTIRNIISAIKYSASIYTKGDILLAWERVEHRLGVNFPYLDNDIGGYIYLDKFIDLCYKELGIRNRISTVGFSRHNLELNNMHKRIVEKHMNVLAGVRLSISQYGRVWEDKENTTIKEYEEDITNFLSIYKEYYDSFGSGSRKMCVELRYNPLVENSDVYILNYNGYMVISVNNYLFISNNKNINMNESYVSDPYLHSLVFTEKEEMFKEYHLPVIINNEEDLIKYLDNNYNNLEYVRDCEVYLFSNNDGYYYSINPKLTNEGNYGFNIYPKTNKRNKSGYIITERFLLNAIYEFKRRRNMHLRDKYVNSSWDDVNEVIEILNSISNNYLSTKEEKSKYINEHVLPIVMIYINALKNAGYSSDCFFDSKFTIDTGMICNLGRALYLFKGLTSSVNEPLTPTHERNYGRYCSTMKEENYVWRLSCGFNNNLIIEKLDLFNTASPQGQSSYKKVIHLDNINELMEDNKKYYLYPGVKR